MLVVFAKKVFLKTRSDERGQAISILLALMLVPIAVLVTISHDQTRDIRNTGILYRAAVTASKQSHSAALNTFENILDERAGLVAACQTMDLFLPAQIAAVTFSPTRLTVRVGMEDGSRSVFAVAFTEWEEPVTVARFLEQGIGAGNRKYSGVDLERELPECVGRAM